MASGSEVKEPGNCKKWVLKVSVHCEGCKKKLKKILQKVHGVDSVEIDEKKNRVTVIGSVDSEPLIEKLHKYGKHAEIWPEKNPVENAKDMPAVGGKETDEKKEAVPVKTVESAEIPPAAFVSDEVSTTGVDAQSESEKSNPDTTAAITDSKKGKEALQIGETESGKVTGVSFSPPSLSPQPIYTTVSYKEFQPSMSYAIYEPPPTTTSSGFTYDSYPPVTEYPSEYYYPSESFYRSLEQPSPSAESYDMFNDENPNACKLM